MRNRDTKHSIFKEYDFIRLYCAICVKKGINLVLNHHDLEKQLYKYYSMDDFKDLFEDIVIKEDVAFPENNCVILSEGFQTALTFGILVNINDAGEMRSIITILKENSENIISKYDEQYVSKMSSLVEKICTQSKGEIRSNGLAVLTPAPKEGYLPSEQEMEILRSRKKSRKNSENIISDVNIFLTKEDHEQIAEDVIYSILDDTNLFSDESNDNEQGKEMGEILNRMLDGEPKNINPLTEIPEPQMKLYGFYGTFASAFFETEEELKEYVEKNDTEFGNTCIIEYLGHVAGRDDVIRLTYKGDKSKLYTSVNEDGYGVYNEERSKYKGEFVWEFNYGSIRELYSAFRDRGIVFEDDIYAKIDERNQKLFELLDANRKGPVLTKVKKDNKN